MAEAVEEDRRFHLAEVLGLKALCQRIPCGVHQAGVEGAADLQGDAAAGTGGFRQLGGLFYCGLLAADDQLARAVVIADLHAAQSGGLLTALCQCVAVEVHHGGHAALDALGRVSHGPAAECGQLHRLLRGKDPGCFQRGVFAQRQTGQIVGLHTVFLQDSRDTGGKGHHAGLGVLGQIQNALRVVEADAPQIKIEVCGVERLPECGVSLVKVFAHAGVLRALAGIQNGKLHWCFLQSSISSSISSRTLRIRSRRLTLAPQKKSPSSTLPFTASMRAWVMQ